LLWVTVLALSSTSLLAQSSLWTTYISGGKRAMVEDNAGEARDLFLAAKDEAEFGDPMLYAQTLLLLGQAERALGMAIEAQRHLEEARDVYGSRAGGGGLDLAAVRYELGSIYRSLGHLDAAEVELRAALSTQEAALGAVDPVLGPTLRELAGVFADMEKYTQSEALYRRMLAVGSLDKEGQALVDDLLPLAEVYSAQGKYDKALPLLRRCQRALEAGGAVDYRARVAWAHGEAHRGLGETEEAELKFALAVETYGTLQPPTEAVVQATYELGEYYRQQDRYEEGEPYLEQALEQAALVYGSGARELIPIIEDYASLLWRTGRKGKASKLQTRAKWIRMRKGKKDKEGKSKTGA
jgi:tetratricopeptide (TPR) repeat protein